MSKKIFAINNTGTEIRSVLGWFNKDDNKINIDSAEITTLASGPEYESQTEAPSGGEDFEETENLSAEEIIQEGEQEPEEFSKGKEIAEEEVSNERILANIFKQVPVKKFDLTINLSSKFVKIIFLSQSYQEKQSRENIRLEVNSKLDRPVAKGHWDYIRSADNQIMAFAYEGNPPFLNLYDRIKEQIKVKPKIQSLIPNELSLTNLIDYNYEPDSDELIAIINISRNLSRIIITQGGELLHISQPINQPAESPNLINKISGRFLYEKDVNNIANFSRIIVTGKGKTINARDKLSEQLPEDTKIEYFVPNNEKFNIDSGVEANLTKYSAAIGLIITEISYRDSESNFVDLVPEYIKERQRIIKLSWHSILVLILLLLTPIYLINRYNNKKSKYNELQKKNDKITAQVNSMLYLSDRKDSLSSELINVMDELSKVRNISKGAHRFSAVDDTLVKSIKETGKLWLENMSYDRENIRLTGYSIYRTRIPELVSKFENASILNITPETIREERVYKFNIEIEELVEDKSLYNPKVE